MRTYEFIVERMSTGWVKSWVQASVPSLPESGAGVDWYSKFFKNLNKGAAFKEWAKQNVNGPIVIKPRLVDDSTISSAILDAEHVVYEEPLKHEISTTININAKLDNSSLPKFLDKLSSRLVHELNHAHQVSQQSNKSNMSTALDLENSPFRKTPPAPKNENEKHFLYLLNNLESDAWVSEVAQDIQSALGDKSLKVLNGLLQQAKREEYAVAGGKIINFPTLHHLYLASNHYGGYLKLGSAGTWQKVKKELYGYLSRHSNK
jgi:hypothetical protein